MVANESTGAAMPEFNFADGELRITTCDLGMKIRGWPDPQAFVRAKREGWKVFRPEFRLLKPPDGREMPSLVGGGADSESLSPQHAEETDPARRKERAFGSFRASLPPVIVAAVEQFQSHQWNLIDLINQKPEALDLVRINPSLAFCLANCDQFRRWTGTSPATHAGYVVGRKQRDILGWLGFPAAEPVVRVLRKIPPEAMTPSDARMLRHALRSEPEVVNLLAHQRIINSGALALVTNLKLLGGVSPNLLTQVGSDIREAVYPRTAEILLDILHMLWELGRASSVPRFESIESVSEYRDALARDFTRIREELETRRRTRAAASCRAKPKPQPSKRPHEFPPPPLPGTDDIIPLTSAAELRGEGSAQHNCVGSYGRRVRSGSTYIYKVLRPERATLAISRGGGGSWKIAELKAAKNRAVAPATKAAVSRWLSLHSLCV